MRKFVKLINSLFISLLLIIVYFIGIGISFGVAKFLHRSNGIRNKNSYWENVHPDKKTSYDYESSY